ncbi:MAG TPA: hypothetical protein PL037_09840, partial [Elusimicrobiales bacterium]|nr:hypothetical protein [Elusimicrobiales bacterium]
LIWHVDESKLGSGDNDDPSHYLVDLMEAGGTQDLELAPGVGGDDSDYYRSGRNLRFDDYSTPGGASYDAKKLDLALDNFSDSANTMSFSLRGTAAPTPAVVAYPQPWRPGSGGLHDAAGMTFDNVPDDAEVQIYNIAGERVVGFTVLRSDLNRKLWDGRNSAGDNAASGVYFVLVKAPGRDVQTLKVAIER